MTRRPLWSKALVSLLVVTLCGGVLVAPSVAHDSGSITHNWSRHYKRLAKKIFFTKRQSNTRFINIGEQASNSTLLDGLDSTDFASSSHTHSGADITSGTVLSARIDALLARDAEVFGIVTDADGTGSGLDADLLDGMNASAFAQVGQSMAALWFKDSADTLPILATSERVVFIAPEDVTITGVTIEPAAALTASDTNYATITVSRRDATGGNRVTVASRSTQTAGSGGTGSWTLFGTVSMGTLSNTSVAEGEKLTIEVTKTGLGVSLPVMVVQVEYSID
ncbi:MAG: hypothetical protein ACRDGO_04625 [Actinomycetota bacterium]